MMNQHQAAPVTSPWSVNDHSSGAPVMPPTLHWNEDPHSVPTPLVGGKQHNYSYEWATEPKGINKQFFEPYNKDASEPNTLA
jgi:hypothetical protein